MSKTVFFRLTNFLLISGVLPFVSGCNGGGGSGSASLGGLFGASSSSGAAALASGSGSGTDSLATIHNPEPTTMLLVGGGMMAMAYFRNRHSN